MEEDASVAGHVSSSSDSVDSNGERTKLSERGWEFDRAWDLDEKLHNRSKQVLVPAIIEKTFFWKIMQSRINKKVLKISRVQ